MVPSRVAGGTAQSSPSSGIFYQDDGQSVIVGNSSQLSSNFGNSSNPFPGRAQANLGPVSGDVNNTVFNSLGSSGPSVGASSLVTDANSGLSGGPQLQRSASINTESYMRLPASPMSFSSNNVSISGASVMDGSSVVQQVSNHDSGSQQAHRSQQYQGASSATSLPPMGLVQFPGGVRVPNSFIPDPSIVSHLQKKPRLDFKQEDILQQQVLQQLLQRQDPMHLQNSSSQMQALIQQQKILQQEQQLLQSMSPMQRAQLLEQQQQQQLQLRQQLQAQGTPPASAVNRPYDGGVLSRRLMQYLYHQRQRPADNTIAYWRKFVAEYYSPRAKQKWCLSLYDNVGHHSLGVFPQASMDAWQCDICGSKSGRGFEATFEVLPRLNEIKFSSGVIEDLLFLDLPREFRFPSGIMMLEHAKAVQETVYDQLRVVREGQLRIFFTPDLKILSWEFCARRHEELLPRRLVAHQVNQLLQVAQKCQSTISKTGADGASQQDLQENSVMVVNAARQLARSLELQSLNDLGFSKRYVRCLQIADVVNSMKDLMGFCREQKKGPIDGLKSFPRCATGPMAHMQKLQEMDQPGGLQGPPTDHNMLNKLMALHPGLSSPMNNHENPGRRAASCGPSQSPLELNNYQNLLTRQKSVNPTNMNPIKQEGSSPFSTSPFSRCQSLPTQALQQQMIQQYLQDMGRKSNGGMSIGGLDFMNYNGPVAAQGQPRSRSNSFKAGSSKSEATATNGHMGFGQKASDLAQSLHISKEMVPDIVHEFTENGFFNDDLDENMNFSWKG